MAATFFVSLGAERVFAQSNEDEIRFRLKVGRDYLRFGNAAKATAQFRMILKLEPNHPEAQRGLQEATALRARQTLTR